MANLKFDPFLPEGAPKPPGFAWGKGAQYKIKLAKTGTFLHAGEVVCDLRIVYSPTRYGSGDCLDPPEVAEDRACDTYDVWYGSTTARGEFNAGGAGFDTLEEAIRHAESAVGGVRWTT